MTPQSDIDGVWDVVIASPMGDKHFRLDLSVDGSKLHGTATGDGQTVELSKGSVQGKSLSFTLGLTAPFPMKLALSLLVVGDTLQGRSKFGLFPASPVTGARAGTDQPAAEEAAPEPARTWEPTGPITSIRSALIVGAGLAGMSTAISLAAKGVDVEVIDHSESVFGAAITFIGQPVKAISELGCLEQLEDVAYLTRSVTFSLFDAAGTAFAEENIPPLPGWTLPMGVGTRRSILVEAMRERARALGVTVCFGLTATAIEHTDSDVTVTLSDGSTRTVDLLVGADGAYSTVRAQVFPEFARPEWTGQGALRWMAPGPAIDAPSGLYADGSTMLASYPMKQGDIYVSTTFDMDENRRVEDDEAREMLLAQLSRYTAAYPRELAERLTPGQHVFYRPYVSLFLPRPWHRGRVALVGDALHTTTAHMSQGGGLALEDGIVLAEELGRYDDLAAGLESFADRRHDRVEIVVKTSERMGQLQREGKSYLDVLEVQLPALVKIAEDY